MYAIIVKAASRKLETFKDTSKHARKEEQLSIAKMKKLKRRKQHTKELFTMKYTHHH